MAVVPSSKHLRTRHPTPHNPSLLSSSYLDTLQRYLGRAFTALATEGYVLERLNLQNNEIQLEGVEAICAPLSTASRLALFSLNLRGNRYHPPFPNDALSCS